MDKIHSSKSSVSLEELLEWKKLEKPDLDFWTGFESHVRSRTIQSIVKNPSFFKRIQTSLISRTFLAYSLPCFVLLIATTWSIPHLMIVANKGTHLIETNHSVNIAERHSVLDDSLLLEATLSEADFFPNAQDDFSVSFETKRPYRQSFTLNKSSVTQLDLLASLAEKTSSLANLEF